MSIGDWSDDDFKEEAEEEKPEDKGPEITLDLSLIQFQPFKVDKLNTYPHKAKDGAYPKQILMSIKDNYLSEIRKGIEL